MNISWLPKIQAHRGFWTELIRENTLQGLDEASRKGYEMAEIDIQLSQDQQIVLFHDIDLKKFSDSSRLSAKTAEQLRLDFQIEKLEEIFKQTEIKYLNIELKLPVFKIGGVLENKVIDLIEKHNWQDRVLFSSFSVGALYHLRHRNPKIPRAFLWAKGELWKDLNRYILWLGIFWMRPQLVHLCVDDFPNFFFKTLKFLRIPYAVWTVRSREQRELYLRLGALSVIEDANFIR